MKDSNKIRLHSKEGFYKVFIIKLEGILSLETDNLANLSNSAAFIFNNLEGINWAGFYIMRDNELVLGPFGGKVACTRINIEKGVCGAAAREKMTQLVENVHLFEGHIACDSDTNSEIVIPIIDGDRVLAVLDIDSPLFNRFDEIDKLYLEKVVLLLRKYIDFGCISN
ncbi:MAG: GAF domain-containing protein [Clostridium sp.]